MAAKGRVDIPTMPTQLTPPSKEPVQSTIRPESVVQPHMTATTDVAECELWQKVGAHLVSITKVDPQHPLRSRNRYVFRETREELEALVKRYKEDMA